jgi:hypothetical protein
MSEHGVVKALSIGFALVLLTGCEPPKSTGYYDQDVRREVFFQCLQAVPVGPQATKYNDWSEVVDECGDQAMSLAARGFSDVRAAEKVERK